MTAENPVLVELIRGRQIESIHRGSLAIVRAERNSLATLLAVGETQTPIYPRSAIKALQALALVRSGAATAFGFGSEELALACASHSGEARHLAIVKRMLKKIGLNDGHLQCGAHWPLQRKDGCQLSARGEKPGPAHNNCSGKHAGMLAVARHLEFDISGYVSPNHPVQRMIKDILAELSESLLTEDVCGIDGCSVPTWALPLSSLATAFAKFASGTTLSRADREAAQKLMDAGFKHPFLLAGSNRFCTKVMGLLPGQAFVKVGAEGVYCAALPRLGIGVALKIDDGARRASEVVLANILSTLLQPMAVGLASDVIVPQTNWQGFEVGQLRPGAALERLLKDLSPHFM